MNNSSNNLNLFQTLFLIKGIMTLLFSLLFIVYAFIGGFLGNIFEASNDANPISFNPGIIFIIIGSIGFIISLVMGILTLLASKYLKEIKNYNFIFVVAVLNCLTGILGIVLCIFTIIELNKPLVKELFNKH